MSSTTTVPLSTIFTPPASCSTSWTYEASFYNSIPSGILMQNCISKFLDTECFPPGFEQNGRTFVGQIFSPGACPEGYVTQSPLLVNGDVTTARCCSQEYTYYTDSSGFQGCLSTYHGATRLAARAEAYGGFGTTTSTSISGTYMMWGMPVTVEFQEDQLGLYITITSSTYATPTTFPTVRSTSNIMSTHFLVAQSTSVSSSSSSSSSLSPSSTQPIISQSPSLSTSPDPNPSPNSDPIPNPSLNHGLSIGAKAGITVGVVLSTLVIFIIWTGRFKSWRKGEQKGHQKKESLEMASNMNTGVQYNKRWQYQHAVVEIGRNRSDGERGAQ